MSVQTFAERYIRMYHCICACTRIPINKQTHEHKNIHIYTNPQIDKFTFTCTCSCIYMQTYACPYPSLLQSQRGPDVSLVQITHVNYALMCMHTPLHVHAQSPLAPSLRCWHAAHLPPTPPHACPTRHPATHPHTPTAHTQPPTHSCWSDVRPWNTPAGSVVILLS